MGNITFFYLFLPVRTDKITFFYLILPIFTSFYLFLPLRVFCSGTVLQSLNKFNNDQTDELTEKNWTNYFRKPVKVDTNYQALENCQFSCFKRCDCCLR